MPTIRLDDETYSRLKAVGFLEDRPLTVVAADAIIEYIDARVRDLGVESLDDAVESKARDALMHWVEK